MQRSVFAAILSAVLAACGGGNHAAGPCSASRACGSGEVCDLTDPDGPTCIDATGDLDGDGIPNDKDFCEHMAGGAFDEDGDGIGDECDPCPIARPPAVAETDGDGVDAPCDPHPTTPGDKILLFNGFNAALPGTWSSVGPWTVQGGEAIMTPTDATAVAQITAPVAASAHLVVFAGYRVDQIAAGATTSEAAAAAIDHLPLGDTTITCGSTRVGAADQLRLQTKTTDDHNVAKVSLFDPASQYTILEQLDGSTVNCALVPTADSDPLTGRLTGETMNQAALIASGATVRFSYLLVVGQ